MFVTRDMKLRYVNERGGELELSFFSLYMLLSVDEDLKNEIFSDESVGNGSKFKGSRVEDRRIALSGIIHDVKDPFRHCKILEQVFNPTISGVLYFISPWGQKKLSCRVEQMPAIKKGNDGRFRFDIDLVAFQPFWEELERTEYIALLSKSLAFPLTIPHLGMHFGLRKPLLETALYNEGDVESGFRAIFRARGGRVACPSLRNKATGQHVTVNYEMEKNDLVEICNYPEKKEILINGENGFRYLDIDSDFFALEPGLNLIGYSAVENTINLDVVVYYTPRFLGVS